MKYVQILLFLGLLSGIFSCKTQQKAASIKKGTAEYVVQQLESQSIDFEWFSAKIKANYSSKEEQTSVLLHVKIQKNKAVWVSGQKFGMEGVRVLITPDSIKMINRLEKTYSVYPFSYISEMFDLPANFGLVQDFFTKNFIKSSNAATYQLADKEAQFVLNAAEQWIKATYFIPKTGLYVEKMLLEDVRTNKMLTVEYADFQTITKKGTFSHFRKIVTDDIQTDLTFTKVTFDEEQDISFDVPKTYKRQNNE